MGDCLKELEETTYWFQLLIEGNILPENKLSDLLQESTIKAPKTPGVEKTLTYCSAPIPSAVSYADKRVDRNFCNHH
jgi:hypothetical protein